MSPGSNSAVTIGAYDGLHLGHRRVIGQLCTLAREEGLESVVVTFDPHPASVVRPGSAPLQLTDLPQRLELLHDTGVDKVLVLEFTPERAAESAEDFVDEVIVGNLGARLVLVGRDFHFGRNRGGNVELLEKMGETRGFRVVPFDLVADASGEVVSSTRIRRLVGDGALEQAAALLGRPHEVRGLVVSEADACAGAGEGRAGVSVEIPPGILLPPAGGYLGRAGLVGAGSVPLSRCHVVVPPENRAVAVLGVETAWPAGSPVRVLFDRARAPHG